MNLFVDDKEIHEDAIESGSLGDALRVVQERICQPGHVVVSVQCDGETVPSNALAETLKKPVFSFDRLDVHTGTKESLVVEAMSQAAMSLEETETAAQKIAQMLIAGQTAEAIAELGNCLRVWQQIHSGIGQSIVMLDARPDEFMVQGVSLLEALDRPKQVLVQIKQALVAQDYVLLADLLQYEFTDVTTLWHRIVTRLEAEARKRNTP